MKRFIQRSIYYATTLFIASLSVCQLSAAANPLNGPRGLALASNGNLYVANQSGNNILVFNPNYALVSSKTITAGVDKPSGVAFDNAGNLYVSNLGNQTVTQYSSTGVQNTAGTITQGISSPEGIAVDGIDNIYVDNGFTNVTVYAGNLAPAAGNPTLAKTVTPQGSVFSIATHGQFFAYGGVLADTVDYIDSVLGSSAPLFWVGVANEALSLAFDQTGNLYVGNADDSVDFNNLAAGETSVFVSLPFSPEGIAIDSVRGRVYISNQQGNAIAVYNTAGTLLKTIQ